MAVGFEVGKHFYQIGSGDFLHAFFSTVAYRIEKGKWGRKYPCIMNHLYQGELPASEAQKALSEVEDMKTRLKRFPPEQVVWDIEDLSKQPPWGSNISPDITDLSNYFVTCDGKDFMTVFVNVLQKAEELREPVTIKSM